MLKPDQNNASPLSGDDPNATASPLAPQIPQASAAPAAPSSHQVLRHEIRVWTRDLLIAIGLALVIIVFLYQPVKVEGTSMAPLLSDQERISLISLCIALNRSSAVTWWCSGIRWTTRNRSSSA